ncbi:MAG: hypothetical protein AB2792_12325 [Candidatus Thiodiazotropha sp.]
MVIRSRKLASTSDWAERGSVDWGGMVVLLMIVAAVIFRYWLTAALPITAHAHGTFDDALFIRLAQSIVSGEWLGEYDKLTLVKAPLYPLFIAANYLFGLQFKAMEHALYILACVVVYFALIRSSVNRYLALVPFLFLLFNPYHHGNVERGWFYAAIAFLIIAGLQYMISLRAVSGQLKSHHIFLLGLSLACLYLSREEVIWIYPLLIVAFGLLFYQPDIGMILQQVGKALPLLVLGLALPVIAVMSANYHKYDFFGVTDTSLKEFKSTTKLLKSVRVGEDIPFVDVTRQSLDQMFTKSPTLAKLKPYLQGSLGSQWGGLMCKRYADACNEIGGGYFFWAFRDSLEATGYFQSFDKLQAVYSDISEELNAACSNGSLDCSRMVWPYRYPIRMDRIDDYLAKLPGFAHYMLTGMNGRVPDYGPPVGPKDRLESFKQLSNASLLSQPKQDLFSVSGWLLSDSPEKYIAIVPKPFTAYNNRFSLKASKDVKRHFHDNVNAGLSRFTVEGPCADGKCELLIMSDGRQAKFDQSLIRQGADLQRNGLHLHIDSVVQKTNKSQLPDVIVWKIEAFKKIGSIYNRALLPLTLFASMIFVYACYAYVFRGFRSVLLGGVVIAMLGIGARLGVLALFDDFTQSPIIGQIRHFIPIMPLLLLFISLNIVVLLELFSAKSGHKREIVESHGINSDNSRLT